MLPKGTEVGANELEKLLQRLEAIVPVVRQQQSEANSAAEAAYFARTGTDRGATGSLMVLSATDMFEIDYQRVKTPEACELHSIGLTVAALGGSDAISEVGWALHDRGSKLAHFVWSRWDGMASHWL